MPRFTDPRSRGGRFTDPRATTSAGHRPAGPGSIGRGVRLRNPEFLSFGVRNAALLAAEAKNPGFLNVSLSNPELI